MCTMDGVQGRFFLLSQATDEEYRRATIRYKECQLPSWLQEILHMSDQCMPEATRPSPKTVRSRRVRCVFRLQLSPLLSSQFSHFYINYLITLVAIVA